MKYILDEHEFEKLQKDAAKGNRRPSNEELQELCTMVADKLPITVSWMSSPPAPWGCILTVEEEHYCDECPVQRYCPYPYKNYSK